MADINTQTKQVLDKNEITNPTKIFSEEKKEIVKEPLSLEERTNQVIDRGSYDQDLRNKFIGEITVNMFGDPTGGLKYPNGNDNDRTFEKGRLEGMDVSQLFDEYQYWNEQAQNVWNLDEDAGMNVKDWFSKMFERLGSGKEKPNLSNIFENQSLTFIPASSSRFHTFCACSFQYWYSSKSWLTSIPSKRPFSKVLSLSFPLGYFNPPVGSPNILTVISPINLFLRS
jgi:hypothetical protein